MTNANRMDIIVVLDRSASMGSVLEPTIAGFNSYLENQRKQPGDNRISLVQFDDIYEPVYSNLAVATAPLLTTQTFVPRGCTALLDALGKTIVAHGAAYAAMLEQDRPGKVVLVIITDGMENASKEYTRQVVFDKINHQRDKYKWDIIYLGANQDAIASAASIGIIHTKAATYMSTPTGARASFGMAANYTNVTRGMSPDDVAIASFDSGDREALLKDKPVDIRPTP